MTILKRSKGSFALGSLQQSQQKYVTTEFGTSIQENVDKFEDEENDTNDENVGDDEQDSGRGEDSDIFVSILGDFGKFQLRIVLLMGLTGLTFSWANFGTKFITDDVDFWCSKVNKNSGSNLRLLL